MTGAVVGSVRSSSADQQSLSAERCDSVAVNNSRTHVVA